VYPLASGTHAPESIIRETSNAPDGMVGASQETKEDG